MARPDVAAPSSGGVAASNGFPGFCGRCTLFDLFLKAQKLRLVEDTHVLLSVSHQLNDRLSLSRVSLHLEARGGQEHFAKSRRDVAARRRRVRGREEKRGEEGEAGGLGARSRRGERAAASEEKEEARAGGGARSWAAALGLAVVAGNAGLQGPPPRWIAEPARLHYRTETGRGAPVHPGRCASSPPPPPTASC